MAAEEKIILLKGQIRSDLHSVIFIREKDQYQVTFNDGKRFNYSSHNVEYLRKDADMPSPIRVTMVSTGYVFSHVTGVSTFIDSGNRVRVYRVVFDNGTHRDYLAADLLVEKSVKGEKVRNVYHYLKDLANFSRIVIDDDNSIGLSQKYAKVTMVTEKSPLADYITSGSKGIGEVVLGRGIDPDGIIFPFGCNRSQYSAVKNALTKKISVIQGPPGTGKTQTILNIVANLIISGKSIEIVSNNNSAVQNVKEKLEKEKYNLSWLVAMLGKSSNKKEFYDGQSGSYPNLLEWKCQNLNEIKAEIAHIRTNLLAGYESQEKLAELQESLRTLIAQKNHWVAEYGDDIKPFKRVRSSAVSKALIEAIRSDIGRTGKARLITRLKCRFKGIKDPISSIKALEITFYIRSIEEASAKISDIEKFCKGAAEKESQLETLSLRYLQGRLYEVYKPRGNERKRFTQAEVEHVRPQDFLREYPIVLSTTFSATTNIEQGIPFDYLIMDEASQVDVSAGALALNAARNAVIVGDERQLPNVVTEDDRIAANMLFKKYDILPAYDFVNHSFLSSLCSLFQDMPVTMLREHYRCAPTIIGFCNKQFYGGQLIAMTKEGDTPSMKICMTSEGHHARGTRNKRQAEMIAEEILPELVKDYSDIGVIAPYNEQVNVIRNIIKSSGFNNVPVDTVHKFQGRENDVIILSTVDNQIRSFVDDPHLLNVAVSRAKKLFVLVVSADEQPNSNIKDLINYISYNNSDVFSSKIRSVFDQLYLPMTQDWRGRSISAYRSENLVYDLLCKILKQQGLDKYSVLHEYPLNKIISSDSDLEGREAEYAHHPMTHVDFLVYDTVTLQPLLAIEVDGAAFHFEGSEQSTRDKLKDSILEKIGLPLLRLATDGSDEEKKICQKLKEISCIDYYFTRNSKGNVCGGIFYN